MFGGILGRIANTVHNDVVAPIQRDVVQPVQHVAQAAGQQLMNVDHTAFNVASHPFVQAWQHINPNSGVNQARPFVQQAMSAYQVTPRFQAIINGGNPSITPQSGNGDLLPSIQSAAVTNMTNPVNQLQLGNGYGSSPATVIHEALHRQWALTPQDHQAFIKDYNQTNDPNLRAYLANRLGSYQGFNKSPTDALINLNHLPPQLQNEVHSFIPEYYQTHPQVALDGPLGNYYSQYFAPNFPQQMVSKNKIANNANGMLHPQNYTPVPVGGGGSSSIKAALLAAKTRRN